jgi:O-antigen ligase
VNTDNLHSSSLGKKAILALLIFWSIFPSLAFNIAPKTPPFLLICVLITISILIKMKDNQKIQIPKSWKYYFLFGCAIVLSQINAVRLSSTLIGAVGMALLLASIPFIGIWLGSFNARSIITNTVFFSLILSILNIFGNTNGEQINGFISIAWNDAGASLSFSVILIFSELYNKRKNIRTKLFFFFIALFSIYILVFVLASRGAILGLLFSLIIMNSLVWKRKRPDKLVFWLIAISFLAFFGNYAFKNIGTDLVVQKRYESMLKPKEDFSGAIRLSFVKKAYEMFKDNPLLGGGWDNFRYHKYSMFVRYWTQDGYGYAGSDSYNSHSIYTKIFAETGLLGIISYSLILLWNILSLMKIYKFNKEILMNNMIYWLWFPAFIIISSVHDTMNYLIIILFAIMYCFIRNALLVIASSRNVQKT